MNFGSPSLLTEAYRQDGFVWLRGAVSEDDLLVLERCVDAKNGPGARLETNELPEAFGKGGAISEKIAPLLPGAFPVRVVSFRKGQDRNWSVPWHQDRVIAVEDRHETPGYTNWSRKSGVWHCEPPEVILNRMVFLRVHLDASGPADGGMEVATGSHRSGFVAAADAAQVAAAYPTEPCLADRGDIQVLSMSVLHRSKQTSAPTQRRVLRVDYAKSSLPEPLQWAG